MSFAFATCNRGMALEFLKRLYPSSEVLDSEESAGPLLDMVAADEIRVCDPSFHGGQVILGHNAEPDTVERARDALVHSGLDFAETA